MTETIEKTGVRPTSLPRRAHEPLLERSGSGFFIVHEGTSIISMATSMVVFSVMLAMVLFIVAAIPITFAVIA